jgi:hypothetical protein
MAVIKIDLQDLIIFEGTSSKTNKPYSFIKLDRRFANNASVVQQLKDAGVRVNGNAKDAATAQTKVVIEQ